MTKWSAAMPTARQLDVLTAIQKATAANGFCPSIAEIAKATAMSASSVRKKLAALERLGLITREVGVYRSIQVSAKAHRCKTINP